VKNTQKEIGGFFELELPFFEGNIDSGALKFQSARAAFHTLLAIVKPARVWMPRFICDAMLQPLLDTGTEVVFYSLTENLDISQDVCLLANDWLLYVNYWGVCAEQERNVLQRFDRAKIILDRSQAFFSDKADVLACITSPRKFFGLPDGGLLFTRIDLQEKLKIDTGSVARCQHMLKRLDQSASFGYSDFKHAEVSLCDTSPKRMSRLTERLLFSVDLEMARSVRNLNFHYLHERLQSFNEGSLNFENSHGALCYPFMTSHPGMREYLIENGIYVATYWPDVLNRVEKGTVEYLLVTQCLPIPCDQRYSENDMQQIIDLIRAKLL
jgi:hypothetical protein